MKEIYNRIKNLNPNLEHKVITVVDGEAAGEKALISGSDYYFEKEDGFLKSVKSELLKINMSGLTAIQETQIYTEILSNEKKLVICGGGHCSIPVIKIGLMLGMSVTVFEDREEFAGNAAECGAKTFCGPYSQTLKTYDSDKDTFFVIMTRGHKGDLDSLREIIKKPHAYIGMIGSKRKVGIVKSILIDEGCDSAVLDAVYAPIGLEINSETPEEIAVSIFAQIIQIKNKENMNFSFTKEILERFDNQQSVLATIISRKGSAPRHVGSKMLVKEDGSFAGTIGGGRIEAETIRSALGMIKNKIPVKLLHTEMTAEEADAQGMVCGGIVDLLLEQA